MLLLPLLLNSEVASAQGSARARGTQIGVELLHRYGGYGDMSASLEMILRDGDGHESRRRMRIRALEQEASDVGDYSLIVFDSPGDVRGTALLSHAGVEDPDQQWLYLPALRRVRRIAGGRTSGPFMGSEFSFEDITGNEVAKYRWQLLGEGPCPEAEGRCYRVETRPRHDGSGYSRRILWIDQDEYRIHRVEFYDRGNTHFKTLDYQGYRRHGGHWRAQRWVMTNHRSHKVTTLVFSDFEFDTGLSDRDFTTAALERIR